MQSPMPTVFCSHILYNTYSHELHHDKPKKILTIEQVESAENNASGVDVHWLRCFFLKIVYILTKQECNLVKHNSNLDYLYGSIMPYYNCEVSFISCIKISNIVVKEKTIKYHISDQYIL